MDNKNKKPDKLVKIEVPLEDTQNLKEKYKISYTEKAFFFPLLRDGKEIDTQYKNKKGEMVDTIMTISIPKSKITDNQISESFLKFLIQEFCKNNNLEAESHTVKYIN